MKFYIVLNYFKYILIFITIFGLLIWASQILRILDFNYSINSQIYQVFISTSFILPSFINPLMPVLILLSSIFFNLKLNRDNEQKIILQYSNKKFIFKIYFIISSILILSIFFNKEIISPTFYSKYKINEIEIRNNLKLGIPDKNEFHINNQLSLFFMNKKNNNFQNIEAVLYDSNQFIKAEQAELEFGNNNINLIFYNGSRIILNKNEKSKTVFKKFIFNLKNNKSEKFFFDKEHYNTFELLGLKKDFYNYGHSSIFQYLLLVFSILLSIKVLLTNNIGGKHVKVYFFSLSNVFILILLNSFLLNYLNLEKISLNNYYILNFILLILSVILTRNKYAY